MRGMGSFLSTQSTINSSLFSDFLQPGLGLTVLSAQLGNHALVFSSWNLVGSRGTFGHAAALSWDDPHSGPGPASSVKSPDSSSTAAQQVALSCSLRGVAGALSLPGQLCLIICHGVTVSCDLVAGNKSLGFSDTRVVPQLWHPLGL